MENESKSKSIHVEGNELSAKIEVQQNVANVAETTNKHTNKGRVDHIKTQKIVQLKLDKLTSILQISLVADRFTATKLIC